ncbi:hypothetical protein CROQUDRAFT_312115 [Cronartium quercuum f. sp. fusiforme G11]|uniref:Uncharacterized protein n=1 Tax=Cronartium quercuum f. sp. fusiforme G11 TaxID=708437 RepID=A0A9P6TIS8_9BASI|nr:hypothetical protein CROQUDRAFT_312115 [Cronartium quercuum f. sp. fusiforme G11]
MTSGINPKAAIIRLTIRDRSKFVLPQPQFGAASGLSCQMCWNKLFYYAPRNNKECGTIGLRCHHLSHIKSVYLTYSIRKYIQDLNKFNQQITLETPLLCSPYIFSIHQRTKPYQSPIMNITKHPKTQVQPATVCMGILINDECKLGHPHISCGHRHCSHLACASCCKEVGPKPCLQHKKGPQGLALQLAAHESDHNIGISLTGSTTLPAKITQTRLSKVFSDSEV